jgi:hypothetical protein
MLQRIRMLTAVAAVIFIGAVINVGFCMKAGASSRKGPILRVKHPGGDTFVSQRQVKPTYHPEAKCGHAANPIFWVVFVFIFTFYWLSMRQAVGSMMLFCQNMDKLEVEEENGSNPLIDGHVGL